MGCSTSFTGIDVQRRHELLPALRHYEVDGRRRSRRDYDAVTAGTAKGTANNQDSGFQFGVKRHRHHPTLRGPHTVLVRSPGSPLQAGQRIGLQFGTGDQDNYVELAIDGDGSVEADEEVGGVWSAIASTSVTLSGLSAVTYITVDPRSEEGRLHHTAVGDQRDECRGRGDRVRRGSARRRHGRDLTTTSGKASFRRPHVKIHGRWVSTCRWRGAVAGGIMASFIWSARK